MLRSAQLSACGHYRYALERRLDEPGETLCWLMLNPSTADGASDDPTIRKVIGFTRRAGYGAAIVVNLFAWRATKPRELRAELVKARARVEGRRNRAAIVAATSRSSAVVCAWGAQPWAREQAARVLSWLDAELPLLCLGRTQDGSPRHPLMLAYASHPLQSWRRLGVRAPVW